MLNIVGQVASKENFYYRRREIRRITRNLEAGGNIQLAAPRRVGKSSILHYFIDNPLKGFLFVYVDVESARTKQEFYKKILHQILRNESIVGKKNLFKQLTDKAGAALKRLKNVKLGPLGEISLGEEQDVDYEEELQNFLEGVDLSGEKLVIMVDEFPEVLLNMVEDSGEAKYARSFLQSNREFRNNRELRGKVQFIYTGSNSLNQTVKELGSSELIIDLPSMPVHPLEKEEAKELMSAVLSQYKIASDDTVLNYALDKVEWLIPFYIQLLIQEILDFVDEGDTLTPEIVDEALSLVTQPRNDNHFTHYIKRLNRVFGNDRGKFIKTLLNGLANKNQLTKAEILDLGKSEVTEHQIKAILESLIGDGYIIEMDNDPVTYKFNSPILKNWWGKQG